ncbi:MAG: NAD(P)-dependent alcohol dehydrogenase [Bdellovibrionota bacterium]
MKAMAVPSYGSVDRLTLTDLPDPTPAQGEVRVRVRGTAVNPADFKVITGKVKMLHGRNFPLVTGYDYAGEIDALGEGVEGFKTGDRVFGFLPYSGKNRQGTFAEMIVAPATTLAKMPASLPFEQVGSSATAALTALQALRGALAKAPGKRVLINGASGGVGSYAVQIAKILGANVTATCSAGSMQFVKSLGADEVLDYAKTPVDQLQSKFSVVFDVVSNLSFFKARRLLESGGRFVTLLPSASVIGGLLLRPVLSQKCSFVIVKSVRRELQEVAQWMEEKRLKPPIDKTFPLKDVAQAIERLEKGGVRGKIAVTIQ